jgi:lantibiotic modifying enzyme
MHDQAFVETADRIGARLCRDAIWSGDRCNWLGWALEVVGMSWSPVYRAQSAVLYDGTAGIAMFLGRLYAITKDPVQRMTALGAINQAIAGRDTVAEPFRASVYSGAAGIAWATIETGRILDDHRMIERGLSDLKQVAGSAPNEACLDIIGGSAGTIQLLLEMARTFNRQDFVDDAVAHGRMLLRTASKTSAGWSWDTLQGQSEKHLCGYGHGAGGIGCALMELSAATNVADYRTACIEAFRYERSHFSPEHHNWPDLRNMAGMMFGMTAGTPAAGQQAFSVAWCHGGPGVGLARLRVLELLGKGDAELRDLASKDLGEALQLSAAACSNVAFPNSGNLSLCHGIGGNADLLLLAAEMEGRADLRAIAESAGQQAIAQIRIPDLPWPCGVTTGGETPNLMLGLAGIGHFFLRLYDSSKIGSLLLIRPPLGASQVREHAPTQAAAMTAQGTRP